MFPLAARRSMSGCDTGDKIKIIELKQSDVAEEVSTELVSATVRRGSFALIKEITTLSGKRRGPRLVSAGSPSWTS